MKVPVDVIKTAETKSYNPGPPQQPVGISGSPGEIKATIVVWVVVLRSVGCEPRSTLWWSCHSLQIDDPVPSITTTDCQIWCLILRIRPRVRNRGTLMAVRLRSKSVAKIALSDKPSL